jgi:hypothetical protein
MSEELETQEPQETPEEVVRQDCTVVVTGLTMTSSVNIEPEAKEE